MQTTKVINDLVHTTTTYSTTTTQQQKKKINGLEKHHTSPCLKRKKRNMGVSDALHRIACIGYQALTGPTHHSKTQRYDEVSWHEVNSIGRDAM
jgi:hypothetical protein